MCTSKTITLAEYSSFQRAFDLLNKELFDNTLPQVVITLQRKSKAYGYFCQNRFAGRLEAGTAHEIAMNPDGLGIGATRTSYRRLHTRWCTYDRPSSA
jgi:hypothetical protein